MTIVFKHNSLCFLLLSIVNTSIKAEFRSPFHRKELNVFIRSVRKVLLLHLAGSVTHPVHQWNASVSFRFRWLVADSAVWSVDSHACISNDTALIHLLANPMYHKDYVRCFRGCVLWSRLLYVTPMETGPAAGC